MRKLLDILEEKHEYRVFRKSSCYYAVGSYGTRAVNVMLVDGKKFPKMLDLVTNFDMSVAKTFIVGGELHARVKTIIDIQNWITKARYTPNDRICKYAAKGFQVHNGSEICLGRTTHETGLGLVGCFIPSGLPKEAQDAYMKHWHSIVQ